MIDTAYTITRVIFDFDNTLFDTESLKEAFWRMALIHGYGKRSAQAFYQESRSQGEVITIALDSYIETLRRHVLAEGRAFDETAIRVARAELENAEHLLPGAKALLEMCAARYLDRYLVSLGVAEWQRHKVQRTCVDQYFTADHIMYTNKITEGKNDVLSAIFGDTFTGAGTAFFNDKPDETAQSLAKYQDLVALVRREKRDERYDEKDFIALETQFPNRVVWSDSLDSLKQEFITHLH